MTLTLTLTRLLVASFLSAKLRLGRLAFNAWAEQVAKPKPKPNPLTLTLTL